MSDRLNRRELLCGFASLGLGTGAISPAHAGIGAPWRRASPREDMKAPQEILDFYAQPARMSAVDGAGERFAGLPPELPALVGAVQGLLLHHHWAPAYGVKLSDEQAAEAQIRPVDEMLKRLLAHDDRPLATARPVEKRLVCVCRHFSLLLVAILRARGVPARARCGFAAYFTPGHYEDHWVAECWDAAAVRWRLVDAQIDALQREKLHPDFNLCDVPRDRFLVAGDAWARCREGKADPTKFGLGSTGPSGLWFVGGNVLRDLASLNKVELLPWDVWGAMPAPDAPITPEQLALLDRVAALTRTPDAHFAELRPLYQGDDRLRVPAKVRNVLTNRDETH
jgi:hypothetical protein